MDNTFDMPTYVQLDIDYHPKLKTNQRLAHLQ